MNPNPAGGHKWRPDDYGVSDYGYRYYSPGMGRWVNRDPLIADAIGSRLMRRVMLAYHLRRTKLCYVYTRNQPISRIDPDGLLSWSVTKDAGKHGVCGQHKWHIDWESGSNEDNGFIIQKMHMDNDIKKCENDEEHDDTKDKTYYEAWFVIAGKVYLDPSGNNLSGDKWESPGYDCTSKYAKGTKKWTGKAMFTTELPSEFNAENVDEAGDLHSTDKDPSTWTWSGTWSPTITRELKNEFKCCDTFCFWKRKTKITATDPPAAGQ